MNTSWAAAPAFLALMMAGCVSPQMARIQEQRSLYESWPIETRQAVLDGRIERGMTSDMVRMALGPPNKILPLNAGLGEMWVYVMVMDDDNDTLAIEPPEMPSDGINAGNGRPIIPQNGIVAQARAADKATGGANAGPNPAEMMSVINSPGAQPTPSRIRRIVFAGGVVDWSDAP